MKRNTSDCPGNPSQEVFKQDLREWMFSQLQGCLKNSLYLRPGGVSGNVLYMNGLVQKLFEIKYECLSFKLKKKYKKIYFKN